MCIQYVNVKYEMQLRDDWSGDPVDRLGCGAKTLWNSPPRSCKNTHFDRNEREEGGGGVGVGVHVYVRGRSVLSFWLVA